MSGSDEKCAEASSATSSTTVPVLGWRCWPLREPGPRRWLVPLGLIIAGIAAGATTGRVVWGVAVPALLAAAAWRFFLPVHYGLGPQGITESWLVRRHTLPWSSIRRYSVRHQGVTLFVYAGPVPLDALGAFYLPWGDRREEVLEAVQSRLIATEDDGSD